MRFKMVEQDVGARDGDGRLGNMTEGLVISADTGAGIRLRGTRSAAGNHQPPPFL